MSPVKGARHILEVSEPQWQGCLRSWELTCLAQPAHRAREDLLLPTEPSPSGPDCTSMGNQAPRPLPPPKGLQAGRGASHASGRHDVKHRSALHDRGSDARPQAAQPSPVQRLRYCQPQVGRRGSQHRQAVKQGAAPSHGVQTEELAGSAHPGDMQRKLMG